MSKRKLSITQKAWIKGIISSVPEPKALSQFEQLINSLGLAEAPERWASEPKVVEWVRLNGSTRYVPSWLLSKLRFDPEINLEAAAA